MNILKTLLVTLALALTCNMAQAQLGKKLGNAVKKSAESTLIRKAEQKTEQAVGGAIDKATGANTAKSDKKESRKKKLMLVKNKKGSGNSSAADPAAAISDVIAAEDVVSDDVVDEEAIYEDADAENTIVMSDVRVVFEDDQYNEIPGKRPSQWLLEYGQAEIAIVEKQRVISITGKSTITPIVGIDNYLPEAYRMELDFFNYENKEVNSSDGGYHFNFFSNEKRREVFSIHIIGGDDNNHFYVRWYWHSTEGKTYKGEAKVEDSPTGKFYRMSVLFNRGAIDVFFDGVQVAGITDCAQASLFRVRTIGTASLFFINDVSVTEVNYE